MTTKDPVLFVAVTDQAASVDGYEDRTVSPVPRMNPPPRTSWPPKQSTVTVWVDAPGILVTKDQRLW